MATVDERTRTDQEQEGPDESARLLTQDMERAISFRPLGGDADIKLTRGMVMTYFVHPTRSGKLPGKREIDSFMMLCKARLLDPWVGDAYLLGYDTKDGPQFNLITSYQALNKRAERSGKYDGLESGITIENQDGKLERREGSLTVEGERMVGAWARIFRTDRKHPYYVEIKREAFDKKRSTWLTNPEWMLMKCAKAAGLREAFPLETQLLYIEEERWAFERLGPTQIPDDQPARQQEAKTVESIMRPAEEKSPEAIYKEYELKVQRCTDEDELIRLVAAASDALPRDWEPDIQSAFSEARYKLGSRDTGGELFDKGNPQVD